LGAFAIGADQTLGIQQATSLVKVTIELSAAVHRDAKAYAEVIKRDNGHPLGDPTKSIAPMSK
jgi:hypothetical protein